MLKLCENTFKWKYQQGKKMIVSDALFIQHIEAKEHIHDVIPLNLILHLNTAHICYNYKHVLHNLYKCKGKQAQVLA